MKRRAKPGPAWVKTKPQTPAEIKEAIEREVDRALLGVVRNVVDDPGFSAPEARQLTRKLLDPSFRARVSALFTQTAEREALLISAAVEGRLSAH